MAIDKPRRAARPGCAKAGARHARATPRAANPARGEHMLDLGGAQYVLRPSYTACTAIEEQLGVSLIELTRAGNAMALTLDQLGVIAAELIRAGADPADSMTRSVSAQRIAEMIFEEGIGAVNAAVLLALLDAVTGGRTTSGEARAVAKPSTGPTATAA